MTPSSSCFRPRLLLDALRRHSHRWVLPCGAITLLALVYAVVHPATWEATQALSIREEAVNGKSDGPLGRFNHTDAMKAAQETIVQLASSHAVVESALLSVGPPAKHRSSAVWPSPKDIEDLQEEIAVSPPSGIEFGQTEVFYLVLSDHDRARALALNSALCDAIEARWQLLRGEKADGLIIELNERVELAQQELDIATDSLATLERSVGSELAELRILSEFSNGTSNLQVTLSEIKNESRQAQIVRRNNQQLLTLLLAAQKDAGQLVATPNPLLLSQPALSRLKNGLVESQLRTAELSSMMTASHPRVQAAVAAEEEIRGHLRLELSSAIRAITADLDLDALRISDLEQRKEDVKARMTHLAQLRAEYANLVTAVNNRSDVLRQSEGELASARATQAAALAASRLTRVDGPVVPSDPAGISRAGIVCLGLLGGLATGLGILFLTISPVELGLAADSTATEAPREPPSRETKPQPRRRTPAVRPLSLGGALAHLLSPNSPRT